MKQASIVSDVLRDYDSDKKASAFTIQEELQMIIRNLLGTTDGFKFIYWILARTGALSSTYTGNADSYYLSGMSDFGKEIFHRALNANPKAILDMAVSSNIFTGEEK